MGFLLMMILSLIFLTPFIFVTQSKILRVFPHYTANFVIVDANLRLIANCIKNTSVENAQGCVGLCIKTDTCTTINYHKTESICELFSTSKFDGDGLLRWEANWVHYETDDDANLVGPVCTRLSPCKPYQVCEDTYRVNASYVCKCKEGFAGDRCEKYQGKGSSETNPAASCRSLMKRFKGVPDDDYFIKKHGNVTLRHCERYVNIALNKPSVSSSVNPRKDIKSANANDGNNATEFITKYNTENPKYWKVDLMEVFSLHHITIYLDKWAFSKVYYYTDLKVITRAKDTDQWSTCKYIGKPATIKLVITCDEPTDARYVQIESYSPDKALYLRDVEVYIVKYS